MDGDAPWTWSHDDVMGLLDERQRRYVELLPRVYQVETAHGAVIPYEPQPYQVWYHAHAPLALGARQRSRIVEKGRNVGLSMMTAMDKLLEAQRFPGSTIAIAGAGGSTSDKFIDICHRLMRHAHVDVFDQDPQVLSRVQLGNGAKIIALPGGSPDKIRSERITSAVLDEFAFHEYPERLMRAMRGAQLEGGTLDIISTHDGAGTKFYELLEETKQARTGYQLFTFPLHDPHAWRQDLPLKEQVQNGLRLLAPWLNHNTLDELRQEDPAGYRQENLCEILDAGINLLTRDQVERATHPELPDWATIITEDDIWPGATGKEVEAIQLLIDRGVTAPTRPADIADPVCLGVDFASKGDLSSWKLWRATPDGPRQAWIEFLANTPTPSQNALLRIVWNRVRPYTILIDQTGSGTGLFEHAHHELRDVTEVYGIHFAQTVTMAGVTKPLPIKKYMANHCARLIAEEHAWLLGSSKYTDLQRRHLLAVRRSDLDAARTADGHGDGFWGNALALHGLRMVTPPEEGADDGEDWDVGDLF